MAYSKMVRSWQARNNFVFILSFLFATVSYGYPVDQMYRSKPHMMGPLFNTHAAQPHYPSDFGYRKNLPENLPAVPEFHKFDMSNPMYRGPLNPYAAMPSNLHELTPYEQSLNNNLELQNSPQYRSYPGAANPFGAMPANAFQLSPLEQSLNNNLNRHSPQYRAYPGEYDINPYFMFDASRLAATNMNPSPFDGLLGGQPPNGGLFGTATALGKMLAGAYSLGRIFGFIAPDGFLPEGPPPEGIIPGEPAPGGSNNGGHPPGEINVEKPVPEGEPGH